MAQSPFPIDPALTAIAIAYKNAGYIADAVLPRVPVDKQKFTFLQYTDNTFFDVYDTRVGRRGRPTQIELTATEVPDFTYDEALDGAVPMSDIENSDARYDPLGIEIMFLQEAVALRREQRAAQLVFNSASYAAGLSTTLSGTSQFSDYVNSDPVSFISDALDQPLMRPNIATFGQSTWTKVRSHPKIVQAVKGTAQQGGIASRQQVADLFELEEVLVGSGRANVNMRGQATSLARLWGKHLALTYRAPVPEAKGAVQFGATFEFGSRVAGQWEDKNIGMRGGIAVRTGESVKERIVANQAGYFVQNAVA